MAQAGISANRLELLQIAEAALTGGLHKLFALDQELTGLQRPTKAQVEAAMRGHVLTEAQLVGTYEKAKR